MKISFIATVLHITVFKLFIIDEDIKSDKINIIKNIIINITRKINK